MKSSSSISAGQVSSKQRYRGMDITILLTPYVKKQDCNNILNPYTYALLTCHQVHARATAFTKLGHIKHKIFHTKTHFVPLKFYFTHLKTKSKYNRNINS